MQQLQDIAPYLAVAALAAALVLAVLLLLQWRAVRKLRRAQLVILGNEDRDIVTHVQALDERVRNLREAVEILTGKLEDHKRHLDSALTNRAIIRYDAFRESGGEQSTSIALLDNYRSGLVISTIAARDFARLYVKHLDNGVPDRDLSPEERQAVTAAVPRPLTPAGPGERPAVPAPGPESP